MLKRAYLDFQTRTQPFGLVCKQRKYELHAVNPRSNLKKNWNEPEITSSTVKAMSRFADIS